MARQKICGRRATIEALDAGIEITELFLLPGGWGSEFEALRSAARDRGIRIVPACRAELDRLAQGLRHQGVVALYNPPELLEVEELLERLEGTRPQPLLLFDGVEDPRNLGAAVRSAEVLGGGGVIYRGRRATGMTPAAIKASAGAAFRLPIAVAGNLSRAIELLKKRGYWLYGLDPEGEVSLWELQLEGRVAFVMGGEGAGLTRLVREKCDRLARIPQAGEIASLNVSVSAALALAEWLRQQMSRDERLI